MSSIRVALKLAVFIRDHCGGEGGFPFDADKVKCLTANTQVQNWESQFMLDPNRYQDDVSVLVATPCMQAGQSMDGWIHKTFAVYYCRVLDHQAEHQQLSRARSWEGTEPTEMYCQPGIVGRQQASFAARLAVESRRENCEAILASTWADVEAERADSANRHSYLYRIDRNYKCHELESKFSKFDDALVIALLKEYKDSDEEVSHTILGHYARDELPPDQLQTFEEMHVFGSKLRRMQNLCRNVGNFGADEAKMWQDTFGSLLGNISGESMQFWKYWAVSLLPAASMYRRPYTTRRIDDPLLCMRLLPAEWQLKPFHIALDTPFHSETVPRETVKSVGSAHGDVFHTLFGRTFQNATAETSDFNPLLQTLKKLRLPVDSGKRRMIPGGRKLTLYEVKKHRFTVFIRLWTLVDGDAFRIMEELGYHDLIMDARELVTETV